MANRDKAVNMASRGATTQEIRKATGVTAQVAKNIVSRAGNKAASPAASMQIYQQANGNPITTQAPARPAHVQESYVDAGSGQRYPTRFVAGAMLPGQKGYDPATGGGVWAAGGTDEGIRAWYRSQDPVNTAGDEAIALSGKDASAFTLDGLYGQGVGAAGAAAEQQAKTSLGYKDIKNIRQGLKIGGNNIISKKEANRISNNTGKTFDQVLSKGLSLGYQVANNAVNKSNKAYSKTGYQPINSYLADFYGEDYFRKKDPLWDMRRVNPTKGKVYSGTYMLDGAYTPLVESRNPRANPLGILNKTVEPVQPTTSPVSPVTPSTVPTDITETLPTTPEEQTQQTMGIGSMSGGGMGAAGANKLGRANSRLRKLGIYGRGTSLLGRGLQYGNVLNK